MILFFADVFQDDTIDKEATNLVFLSMSKDEEHIDSNILYSILKKRPKRADIYWFVHVVITDAPYTKKYKVHTIVPGKVFYVRLKFGFKVEHKVNLMFKEIVSRMQDNGEVDEKSHYQFNVKKHSDILHIGFVCFQLCPLSI